MRHILILFSLLHINPNVVCSSIHILRPECYIQFHLAYALCIADHLILLDSITLRNIQ
jgi:hypothetical protein